MELVDFLSKVSLFKGLPEKQLAEIASVLVRKKYDKDQYIFMEGAEAQGSYLILSGKVKVFKLSFEGKSQILHLMGSGEIIGEVPMFAGGSFPAHAQAIEKSETLYLSREALIKVLQQDPGLAMNMLGVLSLRLRQFTVMIESLTLKETPARLSAYLLHESELLGGKDTLQLDVSRTLLAGFLGTSRENLSRSLRKLVDLGALEVDKKTVHLLNRDLLEDISYGSGGIE